MSEYIKDFFQLLFDQDKDFKTKLSQCWISDLEHDSNKERAKKLANFILNFFADFGFTEVDPVVQTALRVGILLENSKDPLNPYNFHGTLLKKREELVDLSQLAPLQETFSGMKVHLNPLFFHDVLPRFTIIPKLTYGDLPKYSVTDLKERVEALGKRVKENPELNKEIVERTELTFDQLLLMSTKDGYLNGMLNRTGKADEIVFPTQVKLIELLNYLGTLSADVPPNGTLSEQEETFIRLLGSIQECSTGKAEGINDAYLYVIPENKKHKHEFPDEISVDEKPYESLYRAITRRVEEMFSGQNIFMKRLIGMRPQEEVVQSSHQTRYLRNLIGDIVGLRNTVLFDISSNMLYQKLVDRPKKEVLKEFYKCYPAVHLTLC